MDYIKPIVVLKFIMNVMPLQSGKVDISKIMCLLFLSQNQKRFKIKNHIKNAFLLFFIFKNKFLK